MMSNRNILVTGGAGYVGSHACKALARAGYTPVTFDNLISGHAWAVKWGPLELGDISDFARLRAVIQKYDPLAIMHFAAYASVSESKKDPGKYYRNNVAGTLTLLEVARETAINKFIFSSTCAIYGEPVEVPIYENHPKIPVNPYGASKLMIEGILTDFSYAHGLRSISLRYFNAAGADPDAEIGELHRPETHLIPLILDVAAGDRPWIEVFGDDYDTPDGTCIRDYIHVTDLAQAHVLALLALERGAPTAAYNLGNGQGFSVKEVISEAEKVTGKRIPMQIAVRRDGDPAWLVGSPNLAIQKLGWRHEFSQLASILQTAWQWRISKACSS